MKRMVVTVLCAAMVFLLGAYKLYMLIEKPYADINPSQQPTTDFGSTDFDFQAEGLVVQTQQYGNCRIRLSTTASVTAVYVSGKNLCGGVAGTSLPRSNHGIRFAEVGDGIISATGTAQSRAICYTAGRTGDGTTNADRIYLPEGKYTLSGCPAGGGNSTYSLSVVVFDEAGGRETYYDYGEGVTFTLLEAAYAAVYIQITEGTAVEGLQFAPQLEIGDRATEYEAYYGQNHVTMTENGNAILNLTLSDGIEGTKFFTFRSNAASMTVQGYGMVMACVQPIWHASEPHFVIVDDDGKDEVYSILLPLLQERGIPFAVSVVAAKLDQPGYLTVEQLRAVEEAGNKVLCHGKNHVNLKNTATTYAERYEEIVGGKQILEALGFEIDTMVYPNGSFTDETLEITKEHYKYGISTAGYSQWGQQRYNKDPLDPYVIERVNIGSYYNGETAEEKAMALEAAKKNVDVCIEKNYLCVIMTHIGDAGEEGLAQIIELIDYIESKGYHFVDLETGIEAHLPPA